MPNSRLHAVGTDNVQPLLRSVEFNGYRVPLERIRACLQSWCRQITRWGRNGVEELSIDVSLP